MADLENLILRDTRANQPAAGIPGRIMYVTDEGVLERDNGSVWQDCTAIASALGYTPADLTDWGYSSDPGDIADALDQLAARVTDLETGGAGSGTDLGWIDVKADHGAAGDGVHGIDGAITSGDQTFTSASNPFVSGDVGKTIIVRGAGAAGVDLITTIASYTSAGSVELTASAGSTVSSAQFYFGTDDTTELQAAIDAAEAAGGGVLYFPEGIYIVGGALQDTLNANAQLVLPDVDATLAEQVPITFQGSLPQYPNASILQTVKVPSRGSVIIGALNAGTDGNLIGCKGTGANAPFSQIMVYMRDLCFRMPNNPVLTCLDLEDVKCADLQNVIVDTGNYSILSVTEPTSSSSYGVKLPANTNGAVTHVDRVSIYNFYNAIKLAEHANVDHIQVAGCKYAYEIPGASHALYAKRLLAQWNETVLRFTGGASRIVIEQLDIEHYNTSVAGSKWFEYVYDVDDASNYGYGHITFHICQAGDGVTPAEWTVNGAKNLSAVNIRPGQLVLLDWAEPSGTGTVTFSPNPFYKEIFINVVAKSTDTTGGSIPLLLTLNGDTTNADYRSIRRTGYGTNTSTVTGEDTRRIGTVTASGTGHSANSAGSVKIQILSPFGATWRKVALAQSGARIDNGGTFDMHMQETRLEWENTTPITSVTVSLEAGNYASGSRLELWGIA